MQDKKLLQSYNEQLINGEKYYGIIDWYVQNFSNNLGKGILYIKVFLRTHESNDITFQVHEVDIEPEYQVLPGFVSTKPVLRSEDVVEFIADLDPINGNRARKIKFYGTKKSAKAKFREQEWDFRLGKIKPKERLIWKLVARPRREDE